MQEAALSDTDSWFWLFLLRGRCYNCIMMYKILECLLWTWWKCKQFRILKSNFSNRPVLERYKFHYNQDSIPENQRKSTFFFIQKLEKQKPLYTREFRSKVTLLQMYFPSFSSFLLCTKPAKLYQGFAARIFNVILLVLQQKTCLSSVDAQRIFSNTMYSSKWNKITEHIYLSYLTSPTMMLGLHPAPKIPLNNATTLNFRALPYLILKKKIQFISTKISLKNEQHDH